jgi:hypothetical protein
VSDELTSPDELAEAERLLRDIPEMTPSWAVDEAVATLMQEFDRLKAENVELRRVVASAQPRAVYADVTPDVEVPIIRSADRPDHQEGEAL